MHRCKTLALGEPFGPVVVEIGPGPGRFAPHARPRRVAPTLVCARSLGRCPAALLPSRRWGHSVAFCPPPQLSALPENGAVSAGAHRVQRRGTERKFRHTFLRGESARFFADTPPVQSFPQHPARCPLPPSVPCPIRANESRLLPLCPLSRSAPQTCRCRSRPRSSGESASGCRLRRARWTRSSGAEERAAPWMSVCKEGRQERARGTQQSSWCFVDWRAAAHCGPQAARALLCRRRGASHL